MSAAALDVWMNGELVGTWLASRAGTPLFQYAPEWLDSPRARPLSLSLPFLPGNQAHRGGVVTAWFDNLLPESRRIRDRIRTRFHVRSDRAFDLLSEIGRDCVGAVQIVPAGADPGDVRRVEADPLTDADVATLLRGVTAPRRSGTASLADQLRISIAGAQEKTALLRLDGRWQLPRGATPTTHMLKLPLGVIGHMRANMHDSVENEWLCMQLLGELGIPAARTEIGRFADDVSEEKALVIERFDRELAEGGSKARRWILRLPQEDFCQAMGVPADLKYEADGGPGIPQCLDLLAAGEEAAQDALTFAKAQLAFWLLAAPDGHAKNFSIFLRRHGYVLTPLYDVISAWPIIGRGANQLARQKVKLAMAHHGKRPHYELNRISAEHWRRLAAQTGVPDAFAQMTEMIERVPDAMGRMESRLPAGFAAHVWRAISRGVLEQRKRFLTDTD